MIRQRFSAAFVKCPTVKLWRVRRAPDTKAINANTCVFKIGHGRWNHFSQNRFFFPLKVKIVVPGNEDFVGIWKAPKPVEKIENLAFFATVANVTGVQNDIGFWQSQATVTAMRVGDGYKLQLWFSHNLQFLFLKRILPSFSQQFLAWRLAHCANGRQLVRICREG
jgi:hypothetical protein